MITFAGSQLLRLSAAEKVKTRTWYTTEFTSPLRRSASPVTGPEVWIGCGSNAAVVVPICCASTR